MEFEDPEEKDFPGLYEAADGKSKKSKEDSDYSEGDHDKVSRKDLLIGRRKDKKDKGKDRGYAALDGESSPDEEKEMDSKSPSKSKKSKAFKFTSSKSKEKREKSRDKEKADKEPKDEEKSKEKEKPDKEKDKEQRKKEKERKEKDKKEKSKDKDKDKKDKKAKHPSSTVSEEVLELGDVQPVFGVSISLATERSRCHDGIDLPLVVRDCIDYLQEHALMSDQIYKVEPMKTRLQHYKRLYNNRERQPEEDTLDIPLACGLLKLFLRELPEPILTTDMIARFEEVAAPALLSEKQLEDLQRLIQQLPSCNKTLLSWILLHFDSIIHHEKHNKLNVQSLATLLSPPLQMSYRLLVALLSHTARFCAEVRLIKYVPPLTSSSPKLPDTPADIQIELRKQESLLAQIHAEMNAGFVSVKREEQLWEVQRIITQLKRKLRSFEKRQEKSMDELQLQSTGNGSVGSDVIDSRNSASVPAVRQAKLSCSDDEPSTKADSDAAKSTSQHESINTTTIIPEARIQLKEKDADTNYSALVSGSSHPDGLYVDEDSGFLMVPKTHPEYAQLIRLQLENQELLAWKAQLQSRIGAERAEILRLKQLHQQQLAANTVMAQQNPNSQVAAEESGAGVDYDKVIENYVRENALLEHKKQMLTKEIFEERRECISLQVELAMQHF